MQKCKFDMQLLKLLINCTGRTCILGEIGLFDESEVYISCESGACFYCSYFETNDNSTLWTKCAG